MRLGRPEIVPAALALVIALACAGRLATAAAPGPSPAWNPRQEGGAGDNDDDFDLEPVPLEGDALHLLASTEQRAYNPAQADNRTFGVIVDCGSSGTRAHLYEWDGTLSYPQLLHYIEPMRGPDQRPISKKFAPSLSSFADEPRAELERYIKQVLDYIESYIPRQSHPFTGVFVLATAGMRLLDEDKQARIMGDISGYIEREYKFAKVKTSVISGAAEGMYQWISINAKAKRFLGQDTNGRTKTFAVVEMGGASVQVTYQLRLGISEAISRQLPDEHTRQVYRAQIVEPQISRHDRPENTYLLHSTTFLGFGSNSAREAYLDLLLHRHFHASGWHKFLGLAKRTLTSCFDPTANQREQDPSDLLRQAKAAVGQQQLILEDPCLPAGYESDEPLKKPKRLLENINNVTAAAVTRNNRHILGYLLDEEEPYFTYKLKGSGNYAKCKRLVQEMLQLSKSERLNCNADERETCTMLLIGEHFIPFDSIDILGIGDIYYTTNLMLRSAGTYDHPKVKERTKRICNTPFKSLQSQFAYLNEDPKLRSRISDECFKAVWVDTFLMRGLRMPADARTLKTVGKINNDELEWPLGAVLDKSLAIEEAADENAEQMFGPEQQFGGEESTIENQLPAQSEDDGELDLDLDDY